MRIPRQSPAGVFAGSLPRLILVEVICSNQTQSSLSISQHERVKVFLIAFVNNTLANARKVGHHVHPLYVMYMYLVRAASDIDTRSIFPSIAVAFTYPCLPFPAYYGKRTFGIIHTVRSPFQLPK